tara:strand:+ start:84 stop:521 length:438 start_codon:yes stop_codon:yes gene_type:complete
MKLNDVIRHINKNQILASKEGVGTMNKSKSWKDFIERYGTLNINDMGAIGEIIIDKLSGASDEVVEKFKLEIRDLKVTANATHKRHIDTIRSLEIRMTNLVDRVAKKNKQLASLRYRLNKKDVEALRNKNVILSIGTYKLIKENK